MRYQLGHEKRITMGRKKIKKSNHTTIETAIVSV